MRCSFLMWPMTGSIAARLRISRLMAGVITSLLSCGADSEPVALRCVVTAVSGIAEHALDLVADGVLHVRNRSSAACGHRRGCRGASSERGRTDRPSSAVNGFVASDAFTRTRRERRPCPCRCAPLAARCPGCRALRPRRGRFCSRTRLAGCSGRRRMACSSSSPAICRVMSRMVRPR